MLEQLLDHIRCGDTLETSALAARLGTSPQMVEAMLEHLRRSGLIQAYSGCSDGCLGCSLQQSCRPLAPGQVRLWQTRPAS